MERFIKLPVFAYESKAYNKFARKLNEDIEEEPEDIDEYISYKNSRKNNSSDEVEEPQSITANSRYAVSYFKGCSYEPSRSLKNMKKDFSEDAFDFTTIFFKNGDYVQVCMPIDDLEDLLIAHEIVHPDVKKQFSKSKL